MGINDSNKTDQFDNEQAQLVHNDVAYQGATETTVASILTRTTDGTQKTQITDSSNNVIPSTTTRPLSNDRGMIVRNIPYKAPTFSVSGIAITVANQKSMIAIQNTGTSVVKISKIYLVNTQNTAVTGVAANFTLQRIATISGGTSLSIYPHNTLKTLPSGIIAATGATFTSESALFRSTDWSTDEWGPGTLDQEGLDHALQSNLPWYRTDNDEEPITLIQNQALHVKCNTNTTAGSFTITIVFTVEES